MYTRYLSRACGYALTFAAFTSAHAASVSGQGTWETSLQARDLDGNTATIEAYYDTSLNVTWLANANYGYGSAYDSTDGSTDGRMTWDNAYAWAASLNLNGVTGWRLPTVTDTGTPGCNFAYAGTDCGYNVDTTASELAHMFFVTLGDKAVYDSSGVAQPGSGLTNAGPFLNIQSFYYWSGTEYAPNTAGAWSFSFSDGSQTSSNKGNTFYAWALHIGDVGVAVANVPVPASVWLFGSSMLGLIGAARRKEA